MKAISLWQPWASLVVLGSKKVETRSWYTAYRGPLLIHAAKRVNKGELEDLSSLYQFHAAFHALGGTRGRDTLFKLPLGAILGSVDLIDCKRSEDFTYEDLRSMRYTPFADDITLGQWWTEEALGNYAPGRFGWVFANPLRFTTPAPFKGSQGFFDVGEAFQK